MTDFNEVYARAVEVAGASFRFNDAMNFINADGDKEITLSLEPTNAYDQNAIKTMWGSKHIGYVPAPLAKQIYMDGVQNEIIAVHTDSYVNQQGSARPRLRIIFDIILAKKKKSGLRAEDVSKTPVSII